LAGINADHLGWKNSKLEQKFLLTYKIHTVMVRWGVESHSFLDTQYPLDNKKISPSSSRLNPGNLLLNTHMDRGQNWL
jgi:hypothetical protein